MNLTIRGHHIDVTSALREHLHAKLQLVERHFDHVLDATATLTVDPTSTDPHRVEITLHVRGRTIVAAEKGSDMYVAMDKLVPKLERQVQKYKNKRHHHGKTALKHMLPISATAPLVTI